MKRGRPSKNYRHPVTGRPISSQYGRQLLAKAKGLCMSLCGRATRPGKILCRECATTAMRRRHPHLNKPGLAEQPARRAWESVDWSQRTKAIAEQLKVTESTVSVQRRRLAPATVQFRVRIPKPNPPP